MNNPKQETLRAMTDEGLVAVVRVHHTGNLIPFVRVLRDSGIPLIEITLTMPDAVEWIRTLNREVDDVLVGAGTVLDAEHAQAALQAGARYLVSPRLDEGMIRMGRRHGAVVVPSGLTPSEMVEGLELGGDMVKLFPAAPLGPTYLQKIKGPYPQIPIMPTGGIGPDNAADFIRAGADVIGVGSALVNEQAIRNENWESIQSVARNLVQAVNQARA